MRGLAAMAMAVGILGLGVAPAEGQASEEPVYVLEAHHWSVFDGAVQCPASAVTYQPKVSGVLLRDSSQAGTMLVSQCGDRAGILRMTAEDTDPSVAPPASARVTLTGFLFKTGLVPCNVTAPSVVADVPEVSGINFVDRTMTLFGCDTWWRVDVRVWYGLTVLPSSFCERVTWC
jgi:hypothetical protein